jgi:2-(1,2-epoxy-1,2-dihydrophenyl)acetyl-CoA isomerase
MSFEHLRLQADGPITRLTLHRPEKINAFSVGLHADLRAALTQLQAEPPRVLILSGAGKGFCAGQDLGERELVARGESVDLGESIERTYNPLIRMLAACEFPIIAQVHGVAAGAGCSLALACDLVFAARSAFFVQSFVRIGLAPDSGASWQLPRRVGLSRALGLALLGGRIDAQQAADWGLIWACVDDDALAATVDRTATELAALPERALAMTKKLIRAGGDNSLDAQLDLERDTQRALGHAGDYREGVSAFLQKRPPRYGAKS